MKHLLVERTNVMSLFSAFAVVAAHPIAIKTVHVNSGKPKAKPVVCIFSFFMNRYTECISTSVRTEYSYGSQYVQ